MNSPGYVALLICHALSALIGFGALGATGLFAAKARRHPRPLEQESLRRFFRAGPNLAAACILAVPGFGALLLATGPASDLRAVFPWAGLGLWAIAAACSSVVTWPAERALQELFARPGVELETLRALARRCETGAAIATMCGVAALVLMIAQV